jgi:hypothetical protein
MSNKERIVATRKFRESIGRSNELHVQYLGDTQFLKAYDRFTNWQLEYLLPFFSDLHAREGYAEAIDFTMSDLAGVGISGRDRDLERAAPAITKLLPLGALQTIASAAETNAHILEVNIGICRSLLVQNSLPDEITVYEYCIACRDASSMEECLRLAGRVIELGRTLKSLIKIPLIGITLRAMRLPARTAGFGDLQEFLEDGYRIFREIPDIDHFLSEIDRRTRMIFETIYMAPLEQLR